jgi:hypothetical protein
MAAALGREQDFPQLLQVRRLAEIPLDRGLGIEL